jgi:Glycosyl hydrolase catalytic core
MTAGHRMRSLRRVAALALAASALIPAAASAAPAPPHGFFGVVPSALNRSDVTRMAASGVATVRLQVNWGFIEPRPGQRDWTNYDAVVASIAGAGMQPEPVLLGVPSWISRKAARPPLFSAGQRQAWMGFVAELAARYGHSGSFWSAHPELPYEPFADWEVWNEPNLTGFWGGRPSPRRYARLLRITRSGIDRSDPSARIAVGGLFPPPRAHYGVTLESFMQRLYRVHGIRRAFDAVAIHPYASRPKGVLAETRQARRIMNRHHDGATPLWITEVGWTTGGAHWRRSPFKATESQQARFLKRTFRRLLRARLALRLEHLIWFAWQDTTQAGAPWTGFAGLLRGNGTAKPSLSAYSAIAHQG